MKTKSLLLPSSKEILERSANTGASFTACTVTDIVASTEDRFPSLALKVKLSTSLKFASGVYVTIAPLRSLIPSSTSSTIVKVISSPSISLARRAISIISSSLIVISILLPNTGASLIALTVISNC